MATLVKSGNSYVLDSATTEKIKALLIQVGGVFPAPPQYVSADIFSAQFFQGQSQAQTVTKKQAEDFVDLIQAPVAAAVEKAQASGNATQLQNATKAYNAAYQAVQLVYAGQYAQSYQMGLQALALAAKV